MTNEVYELKLKVDKKQDKKLKLYFFQSFH